MRNRLAGVLLSLTVLPAGLSAQAFEGTITMRVPAGARNGQPAPDIEYLARGGKLRVNVRSPMGSMAMIAVPAEKKLYTLMEAQSAYMEQPLALDMRGSANEPAPTITRTGRKETIAGYECEHILIAGAQGGSTDVCMARGLGPFFMAGLSASMPAWQRALTADGGFPLKVTRADGTTQLEVTKIERKKLNDAMFTVPDSYTRMDMPTGRRGG